MKKRYLLFILMLVLVPSIVWAGGNNEDETTSADLDKDLGICVYEGTNTSGKVTHLTFIIYKKDGAISLNDTKCVYSDSSTKQSECNVRRNDITIDYFVKNNKTFCPDTVPFWTYKYKAGRKNTITRHGWVIGEKEPSSTAYSSEYIIGQKVDEANMDIQNPNVTEPSNPIKPPVSILNYDNLCSKDNAGVETIFKMVGYIVQILRWIVPIILIVMGILDFSKAAISSDDKAISVAGTSFFKRMIVALLVFFAPSIIMALLNLFKFAGIKEDSRFISCSEIIFDVLGD